MAEIELSVLADRVSKNLDIRLKPWPRDVNLTFTVTSDPGVTPEWTFSMDFHEDLLPHVRKELIKAIEVIDQYIDGDRGGPTPERLAKQRPLITKDWDESN